MLNVEEGDKWVPLSWSGWWDWGSPPGKSTHPQSGLEAEVKVTENIQGLMAATMGRGQNEHYGNPRKLSKTHRTGRGFSRWWLWLSSFLVVGDVAALVSRLLVREWGYLLGLLRGQIAVGKFCSGGVRGLPRCGIPVGVGLPTSTVELLAWRGAMQLTCTKSWVLGDISVVIV